MSETERFWISWHQPTDDHRPLTYPPNAEILGWWCSGYDADEVPILCALVDARDQATAELAVKREWPEAERWRFCEERGAAWRPSDRFPISDWMVQRIACLLLALLCISGVAGA